MCRKTACANCGKSSWAGCGQHIEIALKGVEEKDRCSNWKVGGVCAGTTTASAAAAPQQQPAAGAQGAAGAK